MPTVQKLKTNTTTKRRTPAAPAQPVTPMEMLNNALASGANMQILEKLMDMQQRWEANQGRKAFDYAIAAAKAEIPTIIKNNTVDFSNRGAGRTNYKYEDLATVTETVTPILADHGLSFRFRTSQEGATLSVTCIISHCDGYFEETTLTAPNDQSGNKNAIQAIGSTLTYLQRMTLKAALGLAAAADDDGQASAKIVDVSDDQFKTIKALIKQTKSDTAALLTYVGADTIDTMTSEQAAKAVKSLNAKKVKMGV